MPVQGPAAASGQFSIGGDLEVNRLGFGAMRITGPGIWASPRIAAAIELSDADFDALDAQARQSA